MKSVEFELLDFDTTLFGFKVAKIIPSVLSAHALNKTLGALNKEGVKLVYWSTDADDVETQEAAVKAKGMLVDRKVTYVVSLSTLDDDLLNEARGKVENYPYPEVNNEMKHLAEQVGALSRFGVDPHMPATLMKKMYHAWISNSIAGKLATHVYVILHGSQIAGMVTLGQKNNRGDIGLIAVSEKFRGHGLGMTLVRAAQAQFKAEGFSESQVVTQLDNQAACQLYEKAGYHRGTIENFYHFW